MKMFMLPALAGLLLGATSVPAMAQHRDPPRKENPRGHSDHNSGPSRKPASHAAPRPGSRKANYTPHQRSCMQRFKSYDPRSDMYVVRGRKVRCR